MDYNQNTQNKAKEIHSLHEAFEEIKDRLDILKTLDLTAFSDRLGMSVVYIVSESTNLLNAIAYKVEHDYIQKD